MYEIWSRTLFQLKLMDNSKAKSKIRSTCRWKCQMNLLHIVTFHISFVPILMPLGSTTFGVSSPPVSLSFSPLFPLSKLILCAYYTGKCHYFATCLGTTLQVLVANGVYIEYEKKQITEPIRVDTLTCVQSYQRVIHGYPSSAKTRKLPPSKWKAADMDDNNGPAHVVVTVSLGLC